MIQPLQLRLVMLHVEDLLSLSKLVLDNGYSPRHTRRLLARCRTREVDSLEDRHSVHINLSQLLVDCLPAWVDLTRSPKV